MTLELFLQKVEIAKGLHPVWFGLEVDSLAEEVDIESAQDAAGVAFPEEYKQFLRQFGGGYFGFTNVFSVRQGSVWNVIERNKDLGLLPDFIAVSDNGVGDYHGFRITNGECTSGIAFRDHETGIIADRFPDLFVYLSRTGLNEDVDGAE